MSSARNHELTVDFTVSANSDIPDLTRLAALLKHAAQRLDLAGEVGIWLCTDVEIADLHLRYMDVPGATDVITFPGDDETEGEYLGDITVSAETATLQSVDAGHSPEREIAYLCLHGLLHIAGYDDLDGKSRASMITKQEALLDEFERENPGEW
jgi:probable rRNA maturation factor